MVTAALGALAVQRRALNPFGAPARAVRRATDPILRPIERRLLRAGGNPQNASWWLMGLAILGGIVVLTLAEWLIGVLATLRAAAGAGTGSLAQLAVYWGISLLMLALFVRVIGSWFGLDRYARAMRPFVALTEWLLHPLRQVVPPLGPLDVTPLVAWVLLALLRGWLV